MTQRALQAQVEPTGKTQTSQRTPCRHMGEMRCTSTHRKGGVEWPLSLLGGFIPGMGHTAGLNTWR